MNTQTFNYFNDFDIFPRIDENPIYNNTKIDENDNTIGDFTDARIHLHSIYSNGGLFGQDTQYDNENNFILTEKVVLLMQYFLNNLKILNSNLESIYQ